MVAEIADKNGRVYAVIDVAEEGGFYRGTVREFSFPPQLMSLFREYENYVNSQVLSLLDEIERKIDGYGLQLRATGTPIRNLQIMNENEISFQT